MKAAIGAFTAALLVAGGAITGIQSILPPVPGNPPASSATQGNPDRENDFSAGSLSTDLTQELITVNTTNDDVLEAFNRARDTGQQVRLVSKNRYNVIVNPSMTMDSVSILDVKTGDILDSFSMNDND